MKKKSNEWTKLEGDFAQSIVWKTVGQEVVGRYVEKKEIPFGKRKRSLFTFQGPKGEVYPVWGSANLDPKLEKVKKGDLVRIVYQGTQKMKAKGKQPMKMFDVFVRRG